MKNITKKAFEKLIEIKSVSVATIYNDSPHHRIMDVMLNEEDSLFSITAKGKGVYKELKRTPKIALCALDKNYNMIRVNGHIRFCQNRKIVDKMFEKNPILEKLYPNNTRGILEAFQLFKGTGEIFELSKSPIVRIPFAFGGEKLSKSGFVVNSSCISCGDCFDICPVNAVTKSTNNDYSINQMFCIECGACYEICSAKAIDLFE